MSNVQSNIHSSLEFAGIYTALVTPFKKEEVDYESLEKLVKSQIESGITGFVVNGTTAESPNLNWDEVANIFHRVKALASDKKIIVGTGSNSTKDTIHKTKMAKELGADASLVVVPYYNKPTQEGLFQHFKAVHDATDMPLIMYNVPGRTITSINIDTVKRLSELKNIVGIKEASGDLAFSRRIRELCGEGFSILSGDDATFVELCYQGANGCISVLSHIIPKKCLLWVEQAQAKNASSLSDFKKYERLCSLLFKEPNPCPVKTALKAQNIIHSDEVRLPLVATTPELNKELEQELKTLGII